MTRTNKDRLKVLGYVAATDLGVGIAMSVGDPAPGMVWGATVALASQFIGLIVLVLL